MALYRRLHIRRFADIVMGSAINGAKTNIQKLALRKSIDVSEGQAIFNNTIRANSPTIYLVDPDLIANVVIQELINNTKYISSIYSESGALSPENEEFISAHKTLQDTLISLIPTIVQEIHSSLTAKFSKVSLDTLNSTVVKIYNQLISDIQTAEVKGRKYISYQVAAAKAGAELRRTLNLIKVSILEDAQNVITNLNNRIPFVGYRFSGTVTEINTVIQQAVDKHISNHIKTTETFKVGNLVHAGHVGIYSDAGLIGINMPAALIGGLVSDKFAEIEQAVGNLQIHVDSGIKLSTNYTATGGMLLDLQFNFAVSMPETLNSRILGPQEVSTIKSILGKVAKNALEDAVKKQLGSESIVELVQQVGASPSFEQFLHDRLVATLKGKKISPLNHSINVKLQNDITRSISKTKSSKNTSKIKAPAKVTINVKKNTVIDTKSTNLIPLQNLINQNLARQIQKNMGSGSSTRVLNYRTGRFAASAKVERMTESRQGMITAFYSYMRNPYGTFAEGGAQEFPQSRNPKLLIATSIRELAGTQVANRMRAILV